MRKKLIPIIVVMAVFVAAIPALAGGMNYARAWETFFGLRWNGYVQIRHHQDLVIYYFCTI